MTISGHSRPRGHEGKGPREAAAREQRPEGRGHGPGLGATCGVLAGSLGPGEDRQSLQKAGGGLCRAVRGSGGRGGGRGATGDLDRAVCRGPRVELWEVTREGVRAGWAPRKEKQEASMRGHKRFGTIRFRRLYKSLRRAQDKQVRG